MMGPQGPSSFLTKRSEEEMLSQVQFGSWLPSATQITFVFVFLFSVEKERNDSRVTSILVSE